MPWIQCTGAARMYINKDLYIYNICACDCLCQLLLHKISSNHLVWEFLQMVPRWHCNQNPQTKFHSARQGLIHIWFICHCSSSFRCLVSHRRITHTHPTHMQGQGASGGSAPPEVSAVKVSKGTRRRKGNSSCSELWRIRARIKTCWLLNWRKCTLSSPKQETKAQLLWVWYNGSGGNAIFHKPAQSIKFHQICSKFLEVNYPPT